ncbi:unnamed protein product [Prunus brigantina]
MGTGLRLRPFDLLAPPKLPFGMEDVYAEGVEKMDFSALRRQKKVEVSLAMHWQEVPLVNIFLEGVKSDLEVLAKTKTSSYADRAQKTFLTHAYAYGEMYDAIQEKNALLLQKAALAREVEELKRSKAEEIAAIRAEAEQKKAE